MKTIRLLTAGLWATALVCGAQEFTEPGWFNTAGGTDSTNGVDGDSPVFSQAANPLNGPLGGQSGASVAEAITPEIQALARGLENDPKRIFDYVHDHIRHVLYFGAKKGAQLTLLERSGNDFDQCALLVALLQAAGYSPTYQFGLLKMPYESSDHQDLRHWLRLSLPNTNYYGTTSIYLGSLLQARGYPTYFYFGDQTNFAFHRVWVKLTIGGTDYYLDPAFKVSEPITGIDLPSAMQLSTNELMTAAGGMSTSDYVQNLNDTALRNKLCDYTTNLLANVQSNTNASVEQIIGGQQIVASTNTALSQSLPFPAYTSGGQLPVVDWDSEPTNLMAALTISFAGTNKQWFIPELQGQRLSLTFSNNGLAQLWVEDQAVLQTQTSGPGGTVDVTVSINHPHGIWDFANNTLIDTGSNDQTDSLNPAKYQRTNATYVLLYAFDASEEALRRRQEQLDSYRQQGLSDSSRQVISETLNVMGMNWMLQIELAEQILNTQYDVQNTHHHRFGRMAQGSGQGYYVDVYLQLSSIIASSGNTTADVQRLKKCFEVGAYVQSAMEHGIIEQLQSSNVVGASTVKMLLLSSTNTTRKVFLANSNNWATVSGQLSNYDTNGLASYINAGFSLLLPQNGLINVAGAGSWAGYGIAARRDRTNSQGNLEWQLSMLIAGVYNGGYASDPDATADPSYVWVWNAWQPDYFDPSGAFVWDPFAAEPVNMTDGSFTVNETDLTLGQREPRGFTFARHYSSARRHHNLAGMAHGWVHNYCLGLSEVSAPLLGLGQTTPAQMAPMLVATRAASELYSTTGSPKNWAVTALIAKWGIDQLINNGVSITLGKDTIQFIKQPDGSFTPPANCTMTLTKTNSAYNLQERHGNTFKFDANKRLTNIVAQYTNVSLTLTYDTSNRVQTVKDWKNRTLTFNYTGSPQRLTSVTDGTRTVSYGYSTACSPQGDLTSVTDPEQKTRTFIYDTNHQITATKNALDQVVTTNVYDDFGRVIEQYTQGDPNKAWQLFWSGYENVEQDPAGSKRRFFYGDKHRLIALRDALGNVSQTFYDGQDHVVMTVSPLNETNRFEFDGRHNLLRAIDPLGYTNQFFYDAQDRLWRRVDARGNPSTFGYNAQFSLTGSTNGAGDWVSYTYNTDGTLHTRADSGGTTTYGYDGNGLLNSITYPNSLGSESFVNNSFGDVTSHTDGRGFTTTFSYNNRRQLTNSVAPTNLVTRIAYDAVGNAASTTDPRGNIVSNTWSATRKLLATTFPATPQGVPVTTNIYDNRDWLARTINPLQQATLFTNDAAPRLVSVTDPLQRTTRYGYDADGRMLATTNAAWEVTRQEWSKRGELTKLTDPALRTVLRTYDAAGNQITLTNRNVKKWQFQFDGANRLTNTISPIGRTTSQTYNNRGLVSTVREPSTQTANFYYDAKGRLTNRTDDVGTTLYRYDANDNLTNVFVVPPSGGPATNTWSYDAYDRVSSYRDADGNLIQYRYDANGNVTNLVYPGGKTVTYFYDSLNRLTNVTDWAQRKTSIEYDLASRVKKITRPNGTVREIAYDAAGQTTNIVEKLTNNAPIAFFKLNWDNAARVAWEFAAPLPHSNAPPTRTMTYDDDNRIATFNGQSVVNDLDGNLTSAPLTNDTFATYTYDPRNRLLAVGGLTYAYDPAGNRVATTNGGTVTKFVINPNAALSQVLMRIQNGVTNYYVYGAGLLYEVTETTNSSTTLTYHYDYRGSTVALTDSNGIPTDRIEYSAYGTTTYRAGTNDTPFQFNGRYGVQTDANGLLYMRARYYNPYICRFINPDPAGFAGGLNFYAYANGNPVSYLDPFGLGAQEEPTAGYWTGVGIKATAGWAYDQVYGVGAQLSSVLFSALGTGLDMLGQGYLNDPGLGRDLRKWADYYWENQTPAANAGWYDPSQPGYQAASLLAIFLTRNPEAGATRGLTQGEASAVNKIDNILTENLKPGPKGDISAAISDMVGNPIPKPGGGTYDHVQDLGNILRGLRNNADALKNATDPAGVAARQQAQQAIQQIEQAIKGAGL